MRLIPLASLLLLAMAPAQTLVTAPPASPAANVDRPFAGGIGRYQQWYSAGLFGGTSGFPGPVRIDQLEFFAGSSNSSNATTIDMEVSLGHGNSLGLTGTFASNYNDTPVVVLPRQNVQLLAGASGAVVMTLQLATQFTWDATRPIVLEIKIFGNSRSNQPFVYNNLGTLSGITTTRRVYQAGSPSATTGIVQQNMGMTTRFRGRSGIVLNYGTGCPGEGNFVPDYPTPALAWPGITWTHQITGAASQRLCMLSMGDNRQLAGNVNLPADIGSLLGLPASGCMLRQNALVALWSTTVGGGAGGGFASVNLQLPAVTWYVGVPLYSQWFVLDPLAPNGLLSTTPALWTIVAAVGG